MSPGVFLGKPDDFTTINRELIKNEIEAINAVYEGNQERAMVAGGECAQRIEDLPSVQELVDRIVGEAEKIIEGFSGFLKS